MNSRNAIIMAVYFVGLLLIQVLLMKHLVLFNMAFAFIYVGFILMLPFEIDRLLIMVIGLVTGIAVDIFYDTLGIHAAACVLISYLRPKYLDLVAPQGGYDAREMPQVRDMGLQWFAIYGFIFIMIHHSAIFFIEAWGAGMFFYTLGKIFFSSLFTLFMVILFQYMIYPSKDSK